MKIQISERNQEGKDAICSNICIDWIFIRQCIICGSILQNFGRKMQLSRAGMPIRERQTHFYTAGFGAESAH